MSFPSELNLGSNKPMSASGKPSINRYRSDNSEYRGSDVIRIEIATGRKGQMLFPKDSFLELKIKVSAGNGATPNSSIYIDQSIYAIFNRMRIFHGSNVVEDTLYCNKLWSALYDLQINETKRRGESLLKLVCVITFVIGFASSILSSILSLTLDGVSSIANGGEK